MNFTPAFLTELLKDAVAKYGLPAVLKEIGKGGLGVIVAIYLSGVKSDIKSLAESVGELSKNVSLALYQSTALETITKTHSVEIRDLDKRVFSLEKRRNK